MLQDLAAYPFIISSQIYFGKQDLAGYDERIRSQILIRPLRWIYARSLLKPSKALDAAFFKHHAEK